MFKFMSIDSKFYKIMSQFVDIMLINVLFLITSIPIITVGASFSAVSTLYINYTVGNTDQIIPQYFKAFKKNFKQSTIIYIILSIFSTLLIINWMLFPNYEGPLKWGVLITLFIFSTIVYIYSLIIYPYIAKFHNSLAQASKNILWMFVDNVVSISGMGLMTFLPVIVMIYYPWTLPIFLYYFMFFGFSLIVYVNTLILNNIFEKYISK